jgi:hypothetical protein
MSYDELSYRVRYDLDDKTVSVVCFAPKHLALIPDGTYSVDELPPVLRDRLAVLSVLAPPPPPVDVQGIGQRIDERTFWVYL